MVEMIKTKIIPACKDSGVSTSALASGARELETAKEQMEAIADPYAKAKFAREARLVTMENVRKACDAAEAETPADKWPIATYHELLFLDFTEKYSLK